jgi:integrase
VRGYQRWRQERADAIRCNQELFTLGMILKEADLWQHIARVYHPLPIEKKKLRKSMNPEQEARLVNEVAKASPRRQLAGHCLLVMANTTMGFGELRHLKREDVVLNEDVPYVTVNEGVKNEYRIRTIPLNIVALASMRWIVKRWEELGGSEPDQYILPHNARLTPEQRINPSHRIKTKRPIFTEPCAGIYSAARKVLDAAGLESYQPYDMRSHAITKLLSNSRISTQVCEEISGHVSRDMQRQYSRQLFETKKSAVDTMCKAALEAQWEVSRVITFPAARNAG